MWFQLLGHHWYLLVRILQGQLVPLFLDLPTERTSQPSSLHICNYHIAACHTAKQTNTISMVLSLTEAKHSFCFWKTFPTPFLSTQFCLKIAFCKYCAYFCTGPGGKHLPNSTIKHEPLWPDRVLLISFSHFMFVSVSVKILKLGLKTKWSQ